MYASAGLAGSVRKVRRDIGEILQTGSYYCNEELARELSAINNGLNHLNLDEKILSSSSQWRNSVGPHATNTAFTAVNAVNKVAGHLHDYKNQLSNQKVSGKQENEIRELHQWAATKLQNAQEDLMPFTISAADRIRHFGDHIGVTDRYTGYRHNLSRTPRDSHPSTWGTRSTSLTRSHTTLGVPGLEKYHDRTIQNHGTLGKKVTFGSGSPAAWTLKGYRTIDSLYPKSTTRAATGTFRPSPTLADVKAVNDFNVHSMAAGEMRRPATVDCLMTQPSATLSVQEQAGINTKFPGKTEYMMSFKRPPMDIPTSHFIINPKPDFTLHGRPLMLNQYYPISTEYQTRYQWPDGNRISKLPWLRK